LSPLILSCLFLIGVLSLVQFSSYTFYVTLHRVVQPAKFDPGGLLLWSCLLLLVAWFVLEFLSNKGLMGHIHLLGLLAAPLIGVELALGLTATLAGVIGVIQWKHSEERVFWVFIIFSFIEVLALAHWILLFLGLGSPLSGLALFELDLYYLLAILSPIPLLILLFGWAPKLLKYPYDKEGEDTPAQGWTFRNWALFLFSIGLTLFAVYYPLSGGVNPHGLLLGYDFVHYQNSSQPILTDPLKAFSAFGGERPTVFLLIYFIHAISSLDLYNVLLIIPIIFLPLLVAASGLLSWEMYQRGDVASWCSFFTAGGVFLVETIYGFFISNIIGLCLIFLSLALLFRYLRFGGRVPLGASIITGLFAYFSHPLTIEVYAVGLAAIWVIQFLRKDKSSRAMRIIPFYLATIVGFGFLNWFFNGNRALLTSLYVVSSSAGVLISLDFLRGGFTSNMILLSLAAIGLMKLKYNSLSSLYLSVIFALSGAFFLVLDDVYRFRLFIALPLGLVAAIGLVDIMGRVKTLKLKYAITSFVLLFFMVYLLRSMANLI